MQHVNSKYVYNYDIYNCLGVLESQLAIFYSYDS